MNAMQKLPTLDQFRKKFRDLAGAGVPIGRCLDMGSVWTGMNSGIKSFQAQDKAMFRKVFRDSVAKGMKLPAAIKFATDAASRDDDPDDAGQGATMDARKFFKGAMRDALKAGRGYRDAVRDAVAGCDCAHK